MTSTHQIKKIFIANRGEIARRIAQTSQKLGIKTVCLTDRVVPPAYLAGIVSEFIHIPEETTATYLDPQQMIAFAKSSGCDAVHPGFGFLSENAGFAESVTSAGLVWVGPRPGAIDGMASKATARMHAQKAGVPCLPGLNGLDIGHGEARAISELEDFADKAGFPILLKAAYGGGGKGMRIVHNKADLPENAKRAASEALSSFGNGSLIVEKYLPAPRHVEVQVLADKHGNVCIIGDRDCSLQRRHQKILEEAPAPAIPSQLREAMHTASKQLATAVGYDSAGTVEFLLDETKPDDVRFYFLEMNTRLQVEHTVSEEVFGIDLVEWQIRVAQDEALPPEYASLKPRGHSIEVRIYAEDPGANFFPAPGPVRAFVPAQGRGVRWELGMDTVDEISTRFDPMISKLVCTAGNRKQALELLAQTLGRTLFAGPRNNIPFLIWLARHPKVIERPVDTHFIASHVKDALDWELTTRQQLEPQVHSLMSALEDRRIGNTTATGQVHAGHPTVHTVTTSAFGRSDIKNPVNREPLALQLTSQNVAWSPSEPRNINRFGSGLLNNIRMFFYATHQSADLEEYWVGIAGHNWVRVHKRVSSAGSGQGAAQADGMSAPVPGKVIGIQVIKGQEVEKGQTLFILESMKMQFEVKAGLPGTVSELLVKLGDQVNAGQRLGDWA